MLQFKIKSPHYQASREPSATSAVNGVSRSSALKTVIARPLFYPEKSSPFRSKAATIAEISPSKVTSKLKNKLI